MALAMVSCAPDKVNDKKEALREYREQVKETNSKIDALQTELDSLSPGDENKTGGIAVEVKEIRPEDFSSYVESTGKVEAIEDVYISPEINGQVKQISVQRGQYLDKGDLMISLSTEVTRNNIAEVKTNLELAKKVYEKQKSLWEKEIGSEMQYLEAKNRKESLEARLATLESQLDMAYLHAPFPGSVEEIHVKEGELATPGMRLVRLVNLDDLRITADVSEAFIGSVSKGEMVNLRFPSLPDLTMERPVSRVGSVIDPVTRTFKVEVLTKNPGRKIKPNLLCAVRIEDYEQRDAMLVPSIILKEDFSGTFLFRITESSGMFRAEKVYVETGKTVQDKTRITKGIGMGDRVIVKGYNLVTDGATVRITK